MCADLMTFVERPRLAENAPVQGVYACVPLTGITRESGDMGDEVDMSLLYT